MNVIRSHLLRCNINQTDLSIKVGVSKSTASDWISGKKFPRKDNVKRMAKIFGIKTESLAAELYK